MNIRLDYGQTGLNVNVPDEYLLKILRMKAVPCLPDPAGALREKLKNYEFSKKLGKTGRRDATACIVVSDKTRPVPNKIILPVVLEFLQSLGVKKEHITILIATGMHLPTEGKDLVELLGEEIATGYKTINHLAQKKDAHTFLGRTSSGTPVYVNTVYHESDLKILTGFIEPHFMAGFSGGRKSICPGIVSLETIKVHHGPRFLESPFSAPGVLEKNPCHQEALEVAKTTGADLIVNVTLDGKKRITGIFVGDLEAAHLEGMRFCGDQASDYLSEPVDVVITTGGGYPLDCTFYQTVKGLVGALSVVREGGTIIIASGCQDGIGSPEFKKLLLEMENHRQFIEMIKRPGYFVPDQWEVEELIKVLKKVRVKMYSSGLSEDEMDSCHVEPIGSVEEGIAETLLLYGKTTSIAVIPNGPYLLAKLKERRQCITN